MSSSQGISTPVTSGPVQTFTNPPPASSLVTSAGSYISPQISSTSSSTSSASSGPPGGNGTVVNDQGLSSGAVAGIGVGTFLAGVILAFLCFYLISKSRNKRASYESTGRQPRYRDSERSEQYGEPMKGMSSTAQSIGAGKDINLNRILLEPVASADIKTDMLAIGSQIVQHIDNNYHLKPVGKLPATFADILEQDGYSTCTGISIEQLGNLLQNTQMRRAAIRHIISYFIFSKIAFTGNAETSLLPGHVIGFLRHIPPPERTSGSREAFDQALTTWRRLSAYLLQTVRSSRDPLLPQDNDIQPAVTRNVTAVQQVLAPFVIAGSEERQMENLQGLMADGARLGLLLFQHPETWIVDWEVPPAEHADSKSRGSARAKDSAVVIFPGLIKTADQEGKRYSKVKVVLNPEVVQI